MKKATYAPNALPVEAVPNLNGVVARRVHVTERFLVTPAEDTWYVAMVRLGSAARDLFPLTWDGIGCLGGLCTVRPAKPRR